MKKLMTMIAAVATAFGLFAAEGDIDSFNAATGSLTDGRWSYTNAVITSENLPPSAEVSFAGAPQKLVLATGTKTLSRNYPDAPVSITGDALYLDTYINFDAPFEEMPTVDSNAKIAAFVLDNSELVAEMRKKGATVAEELVSTNLYAIGGYWDATANEGEGAFVPAAFMFDTGAAELDNKLERRLSIKAYKNVLANETRMGFRFFLDGVEDVTKPALQVRCMFPITADGIDFANPIAGNAKYLGLESSGLAAEVRGRASASDHSLLVSLSAMSSLNALDFAGKGALGSLLLTTNKLSFIENDAYTMAVTTKGVDSVTVTGAEYQDGVITFAAGTTSIGVTATYSNGCTIVKWTYQEGDVTPDPVTAERTISPVKGATLNIRAVASAATVKVDGVTKQVETLADAVKAITESVSGSGSIVLDNNAALGSTALTFAADKTYVLDLAGKNITGSGSIAYKTVIQNGGNLTITNSTTEIGAIIPSNVENVKAVNNKAGATLVIAGGKFDGKIADANVPSTITTVGGLFKQTVFAEKTAIPGVPPEGYEITGEKGDEYWTVVEVTAYSVTVVPAEHGQVTVDKAAAAAGETVTITATPEPGYKLGTITVMQADETPVTVANGKFVMPAANVTVSATFIAKKYVAQIGDGQLFETLAEAFAAVENDETIKLLAAVTEGVLYKDAKRFTIDLNGQTWTWNGGQEGNWAALKVFGGAADITIVDKAEGGKMYAAGDGFCIWAKSGKVTINSGKFYNNSNDDYAIYVNGTAHVVINNGEFRNEKDAPYIWKGDLAKLNLNVQNNNPNATITVYGGTYSAEPKDDSGVKFVAEGKKAVENEGIWTVKDIEYATLTIATVENLTISVTNAEGVAQTTGAKFDKDLATELYVTRTPDSGYELDGYATTETITMSADVTVTGAVKSAAQPVDPGVEKKYNTEKEAEDAAKNINDNKEAMIKVPAEAEATKTAYLERVAAKVEADGLTVVVDIAADKEATFKAELDTEIKKTTVAAALTDASATTASITTVAGFYYWVEGGVEVGTINQNGAAKIGTGSTIELTKPALGTTDKAFYKLAVGVKDPAK